jgi:ABC-2 type transport system permease protein
MKVFARYSHMLFSLSRYAMARELAFRGNFLVKVSVEAIWLFILLAFYRTVFARTTVIAGWPEAQYMFFVGCFFALSGIIETLFLENCNEFAELVRTGDLDFLLLKPIDEQFLISCRKIDWSTGPNIFMGSGVMLFTLYQMHWSFDPVRLVLFLVMFACGTAIAYSFMLVLTALSVWMVRNQSLMEMWWLVTTLMRYPREIYKGKWGGPIGIVFFWLIPLMVVTNVPAEVAVRESFDPWHLVLLVAATLVMLFVSRRVFFLALRTYRSASS